MKKAIFLVLGILLISNTLALVSAETDVAYIVLNSGWIKPEFTSALDDLSLSYEIVCYNTGGPCDAALSTYNFADSKMILLNNDYFPILTDIPINDHPSLLVNGRHLEEWGWTKRISKSSSSQPLHLDLSSGHELSSGLGSDIQAYESSSSDMYYLDSFDIFSGIELVGALAHDADDVVVGLAREGTTLTKVGKPDTIINADTIFFGLTDSADWTSESEELFKNALNFLTSQETYELDLDLGINLVSIPITLLSNDVVDIFGAYSEIISVKKYFNGGIVETSTMDNGIGYFVETTSPVIVILEGSSPQLSNVELDSGINLVGINSLSNINLEDLDLKIIEVAKRKTDGTYDIATKYVGVWNNPQSIVLEPGIGYWFKTNSQLEWGGQI
jgi:hypothetical protein